MKILFASTLIPGLILGLASGIATAQEWGRPAYPANWHGGPPLPPLGSSAPYIEPYTGYRAGTVATPAPVAGVVYVQPYAVMIRPDGYAVPQRYVTRTVKGVYWGTYEYRQRVPVVQGPPQSRCIVANLNGTALDEGCALVSIPFGEEPRLRAKFGNYAPDSGYVTNLPADDDYR